MEKIQNEIDEKLWIEIKHNYNSENYRYAILDAIQLLGDTIREKSGLSSDGQQLIGKALGGKNPIIKLTKLRTESENNIQKGIESILRGLYQAYRNPRSHSKVKDTKSEADEILVFINHLLKKLIVSTGKFSKEMFIQRILDKDFVPDIRYAKKLVDTIPKSKYYDIALEVYNNKGESSINNLKIVWQELYVKLNNNERTDIIKLASEELIETNSIRVVALNVALFSKNWEELEESARLRAENKLIKSILVCTKDDRGNVNTAGQCVSWFTNIVRISLLKFKIAEALFESLNSYIDVNHRFVLDFFGMHLKHLEKELLFESFYDLFKSKINEGYDLFYDYAKKHFNDEEIEKIGGIPDNYISNNVDDLPF